MAAEELFFGESSSGVGGDLATATATACQMVGALGMGSSLIVDTSTHPDRAERRDRQGPRLRRRPFRGRAPPGPVQGRGALDAEAEPPRRRGAPGRPARAGGAGRPGDRERDRPGRDRPLGRSRSTRPSPTSSAARAEDAPGRRTAGPPRPPGSRAAAVRRPVRARVRGASRAPACPWSGLAQTNTSTSLLR